MSLTGTAAFDSTMHTTNVWLNEIMEQMAWTDRQRAYHALGAVLHALRDRLSVEHVAAFAAQLPLLVRGLFYEGWHPGGKPLKERKKEEFLAHVSAAFQDPSIDSEPVCRAVFQVVARHVSRGEMGHLEHILPVEIRSLMWS